MEEIYDISTFCKCFKQIRKANKKTQVEFYRFLFPDDDNSDYNIRKQIYNIEHEKIKTLNADLLIRLCSKCDVSADYLLGLSKDFSNHEIEFVCQYTGLEENAVKQLHEWNVDKNNGSDISLVEEVYLEDSEEEHMKMLRKQDGIAFLRIVNYLFKSGTRRNDFKRNKKEPYSNLVILYALYLLSMAKPTRLNASLIMDDYKEFLVKEYPWFKREFDYAEIDLDRVMAMVDNNGVHYLLDPKKTLEDMGRKQLDKAIDWLIEQVKKDDESGMVNNDYN